MILYCMEKKTITINPCQVISKKTLLIYITLIKLYPVVISVADLKHFYLFIFPIWNDEK